MKAAPKHTHFLQGDLKKYIVTINTMKAQTSNAKINGYENVYMIFLFFENTKEQKRDDGRKKQGCYYS